MSWRIAATGVFALVSAGTALAFPAPKPKPLPPLPDLTGTWQMVESDGRPYGGHRLEYEFGKDGTVSWDYVRSGQRAAPASPPVRSPISWKIARGQGDVHLLDWTNSGRVQKGIVRLAEGILEVAIPNHEATERPTSFDGDATGRAAGQAVAVAPYRKFKLVRTGPNE